MLGAVPANARSLRPASRAINDLSAARIRAALSVRPLYSSAVRNRSSSSDTVALIFPPCTNYSTDPCIKVVSIGYDCRVPEMPPSQSRRCRTITYCGHCTKAANPLFGITVDRKHTLKWLFLSGVPGERFLLAGVDEKATVHCSPKVYAYSENALVHSLHSKRPPEQNERHRANRQQNESAGFRRRPDHRARCLNGIQLSNSLVVGLESGAGGLGKDDFVNVAGRIEEVQESILFP